MPQPQQTVPSSDATEDSLAATQCHSFVVFTQILVGCVAPTLVLSKLQPPTAAAAAAAAGAGAGMRRHARSTRSSGSTSSSTGSGGGERDAGSCRPRSRLWVLRSRTLSWLAWAVAEAEASLNHLCDLLTCSKSAGGSWALAAAAWWLLLDAICLAVLALEQPV